MGSSHQETPVGVEPTWTGLQPVASPFGSSVKNQCPSQDSNPELLVRSEE
jgi:hypothetical protein